MDIAVNPRGADALVWNCDWLCEKWSEEAVSFARQKLDKLGITAVRDGTEKLTLPEKTWDNASQAYVNIQVDVPRFISAKKGVTSTVLRKLGILPEITEEVKGNLLLNEGIQEMWDLVIGATATSAYTNGNAQLGVGSNTTAAAASQTDLQDGGAVWKAMNASYPIRTNQTMDFRSDFTSGEANFAWQEWGIRNGATRNKNMNRKVESLGTKSTGTWTLTASITLS